MDPLPKRRGRPRKYERIYKIEKVLFCYLFSRTNVVSNNEIQTNECNIFCFHWDNHLFYDYILLVIEPKIENLLTMNTMIVEQRKAAKVKQKSKF